jgi:hypothetical protein
LCISAAAHRGPIAARAIAGSIEREGLSLIQSMREV